MLDSRYTITDTVQQTYSFSSNTTENILL